MSGMVLGVPEHIITQLEKLTPDVASRESNREKEDSEK
jgi:hypothetical protein